VEKLYSIGETASLFNITVQTLRFYEKIGLLVPARVNSDTGYRYYSQEQFHYIDRIHYLKGLGLSLKDVKNIITAGQVDRLQYFLRKNLAERQREFRELQEIISDLKWYIEYFTYMDNAKADKAPRIAFLEERFTLCAPCVSNEPFGDIELRLTKLRSRDEFKSLGYRRHYGFIIDFDDMVNKRFAPIAAYIFLKFKPDFASSYITILPAGEYLCFTAQLRLNEWNSNVVKSFFDERRYKPVFAIANEYEDNLAEYTATPYEVQVYLQPNNEL
jgi:DNA-binding transcriptional MerR regulator